MGVVKVRVVADRLVSDLLAYTLALENDIIAVDVGPDVVAVDAGSCSEGWAATVAEVRVDRRSPHTIVLANDDDVESAVAAARARVTGWLPRRSTAHEFVTAVRTVAEGDVFYPPRHLGAVLRALWTDLDRSTVPAEDPTSLTEREDNVLRLLVEGLSAREIADRMDLSVNTVRTHVSRVFRKLRVHHRLEAVRVARAAGLLPHAPEG